MTCIVGFVDKKNDCVWMGGDSLGSNGYTKNVETNEKVFHHNLFKEVVIGSTTSFRHIDLLQYSENLFPEIDFYKKSEIDRAYMVKTFIPNLISLFQNNIYHENAVNKGGNFLLGAKNKLFEIQCDYSVLESATGFASVGCGEDVAMGSLISTTKLKPDLEPKEHIRLALEAAEQACCGVQRPFRIINTKDPEQVILIE